MSSVPDMDAILVSLLLVPTSHCNLNSNVRIAVSLAVAGCQVSPVGLEASELCCLSVLQAMGQGAQQEGSGHTWLQDLLPSSLLWLLIIGLCGTH